MRRALPLAAALLLLAAAPAARAAAPAAAAGSRPPAPGPAAAFPPLAKPMPALAHVRALLARESKGKGATAPRASAGHPELGLRTKAGYWVQVFGAGRDVALSVSGDSGLVTTTYVVRGTARGGRIEASFGELGSISMRFRPAAGAAGTIRAKRCFAGRRHRLRQGVFVGRFRFRGEGGYVTVDARRVSGIVRDDTPCHGGKGAARARGAAARASGGTGRTERTQEWSYLRSSWREAGSAVSFVALELDPGEDLYTVDTISGDGRMAILRSALAGPTAGFTLSDALSSAKVHPPRPFHGSGRFRENANGRQSWTGALAVNFPGYPDFPLTAPPYHGQRPYQLEVDRTANPFLLLFLLLG